LQDNIVGGSCFTLQDNIWAVGGWFGTWGSSLVSVWFIFFVPMGVMALLEDKQSLGREDLLCPHFWVPLFCTGNDFCGLSVKEKGVKMGHLMSLS
jgi:hypothetical protein